MRERGKHVGVLSNGQLKPALATGREIDGQFGIRLLVSIAPMINRWTAEWQRPIFDLLYRKNQISMDIKCLLSII